MGYTQPMQSNSHEQFVQIPLHIEHSPTTTINQTSDSKQRRNKLLTIIICIIFAITGQSITRLLENYYFLHRNKSHPFGIWTQGLLQVVGFPILLFPFLLLVLLKKQKQLLITSGGVFLIQVAIYYPILCIYMFFQAFFSNVKYRMPFKAFTLCYTTQLLFTSVFSAALNKIKFNTWKIISVCFSILAGALTFSTFSAGSPIFVNWRRSNKWKTYYVAFCAALFLSLLLCTIRTIFDLFISICKKATNRKKPSFAVVLELVIFLSFLATIVFVAGVFISGEHHNLNGEMNGFSKGEVAYVRTVVGQAVAWQIYWVGILGLVFVASAMFSNVIIVCTWPIVSLLVAFFHHRDRQYDILLGTALGMAALSVVIYICVIHTDKTSDESTDSGTDL